MVTPEDELKTNPLSPREVAVLYTNGRNPTPCTTPRTRMCLRLTGSLGASAWRLNILRIILGQIGLFPPPFTFTRQPTIGSTPALFGVSCHLSIAFPVCHQALLPGRVPQVRPSVPGLNKSGEAPLLLPVTRRRTLVKALDKRSYLNPCTLGRTWGTRPGSKACEVAKICSHHQLPIMSVYSL